MKTLICYGDSNTYGYDPRSYFGSRYPADERWPDIIKTVTGWNVLNEGINGQEVQSTPPPFPTHADLLIIMLGTNDLLQGVTATEAACRMEKLLKQRSLNQSAILLVSPPALRPGSWVFDKSLVDESTRLSQEYRKLAQQLQIHFADSQEWNISVGHDGVHFTPNGHKQFAKEMLNILFRLI